MANRQSDAALDYMRELGIRPARNPGQFASRLAERLGRRRAAEALDALNRRSAEYARGESADNAGFYEAKNADIETGLAVSGIGEGDVLRRLCEWIYVNRECFRGRVLEIGCDNGILSCFAARLLPECELVCIDRCAASIEAARRLAGRLGVTNARFEQAEAGQLPRAGFNTVFSSRTAHENFRRLDAAPVEGVEAQAELFERCLADYAACLAGLCAPGGRLLTVERMGRTSLFRGWLRALAAAGMYVEEGGWTELSAQELGGEVHFQALVMSGEAPREEPEIEYKDVIDLASPAWRAWIG